jgi:hypothetical protein
VAFRDHGVTSKGVVTRANRFQNSADSRTMKTPPKDSELREPALGVAGAMSGAQFTRRDNVDYTRVQAIRRNTQDRNPIGKERGE